MLQVEIYTPEKTVYKGNASGVQMPGINGKFEVLTGHAPLITALAEGAIRINREDDNSQSFEIESGFAEVLEDHISILVEGLLD